MTKVLISAKNFVSPKSQKFLIPGDSEIFGPSESHKIKKNCD